MLILAAITLITIDARSSGGGMLGSLRGRVHDGLSFVQSTTHSALAPIGDFFTGALQYKSLRTENQRLRQQVAGLGAQAAATAADQAEAAEVIANAHLPFVGSIDTEVARVIDQGGSNFQNVITIDKGSSNGLVPGQPVVAANPSGGGGGLVGSVGTVGAHTATVDLITDPSIVVGVQLDHLNVGFAQGVGSSQPLRVSVISTNEPVPKLSVGQSVVTSGLPLERYPFGIPVGTVSASITPPGSQEPTVSLKPVVDLSGLSVVAVELWSPQTAAAP